MRELTNLEVEQVDGAGKVEAGVFTVGLGTAVAAGTPLGPVGMGVAAVTYSVVFGVTYLLAK